MSPQHPFRDGETTTPRVGASDTAMPPQVGRQKKKPTMTAARVASDALTLALLNLAERGERTQLWISDRSREAPESAQAA